MLPPATSASAFPKRQRQRQRQKLTLPAQATGPPELHPLLRLCIPTDVRLAPNRDIIKRHPSSALLRCSCAQGGVLAFGLVQHQLRRYRLLPRNSVREHPSTSRIMSTAVAAPSLTQPSTARDASPKSTYPALAPSTHPPSDRNSATSTAANANTPIVIGEGVAQQKSTPEGKRSPNSSVNLPSYTPPC